MIQAQLSNDLRNFEEVTSKCNTCGSEAYPDPELTEDGRHRNEAGEVTMIEFRCENGHGFTEIVNHPESDIGVKNYD